MAEQIKVSFNEEHKALFDELAQKGFISEEFNDFVKGAFHDAIDNVKAKNGMIDLSHSAIEKITQEVAMRLSKKKA